MIPVLSIHQPYASLIFAPAHCGECGGSGLTDDRDSDGYPRPAQCVCPFGTTMRPAELPGQLDIFGGER